GPCSRAIRHVHQVDAVDAQLAGPLDEFIDTEPARWNQFNRNRERAASQPVRHPRLFRTRHWRDERRHRDPRSATPRAGVRPGLRSDLTYRALDVTDVFRRSPATTADQADAAADEPLRV